MSTSRDDTNLATPASSTTAKGKAPYARPELVEYGSVEAITQGGGSTPNDGGGMLRMAAPM
jgi:hypothetical protein